MSTTRCRAAGGNRLRRRRCRRQTLVDRAARAARRTLARRSAFETAARGDRRCSPSHNAIQFHTWSDDDCCLPRGATRATLRRHDAGSLALHKGDVLVLEEVLGPRRGLAGRRRRGRTATSSRAGRREPLAAGVDPLTEQRRSLEIALARRGRAAVRALSVMRSAASACRRGGRRARQRRARRPRQTFVSASRRRRSRCRRPRAARSADVPAASLTQQALRPRRPAVDAGCRRSPARASAQPAAAGCDPRDGAARRSHVRSRRDDDAGRPRATCSPAIASPLEFVVETENDGGGPDAALRRRRHGRRRPPGARSTRDVSHRQRRGRQRRRRRRSPTSCAARSTASGVRNPLPARGGVDPRADVAGAAATRRRRSARRSARSPRTTTRAVAERAPRRAARRRHAALDRQLAHRVRHRRPARRPTASTASSSTSCAAFSSATAWPATTSRSTARASCRSTRARRSACGAGYFRADVERALLDALRQRDARRRPARLLPSRQLHVRPAGLPEPRSSRAAMAVPGVDVGPTPDASTRSARGRAAELDDGRARDSAGWRSRGSTTTRAAPRTGASTSTLQGGP